MHVRKKYKASESPRSAVLAVLGAVTLGVAVLSVAVSYQILEPRFGVWAVPTVGALDCLWVVFQATEVLAGNHRGRARRVQAAGLALTLVNAAIPTADLIMSRADGADGFELAVVLTPIAIMATKLAWWITLPALGRRTSPDTRQRLEDQRREVADRLEEMEAEAAHRIELLRLATDLDRQVAKAETAYRLAVLEMRQDMTEELHRQAAATAKTLAERSLPAAVAAIPLPVLGEWQPTAPALPGTPGTGLRDGRDTAGTQVSALSETAAGTLPAPRAVTLDDLAAVAGVPVPQLGVALTDAQLDVVLRHLRYRDDPPMSYRQALRAFRRAGYVGGEERVRRAWTGLLEQAGEDESDDEPEQAGV
ncbi:hypothetical protein ACIQV2_33000 [Streptomyces globosus]|uniref:hypothetical protein n=1 Tax=Streptomyces globosus TaxID=68209 RepID=UPI003813FD8F